MVKSETDLNSLAAVALLGAAALLLLSSPRAATGALQNSSLQAGTGNSPDYWWTYNPQGGARFTWTPGTLSILNHSGLATWGQTVSFNTAGARRVSLSANVTTDAASLGGVDPGIGIVVDMNDGAPG